MRAIRILGAIAGTALVGFAPSVAGAAVVAHDNFDGTFKWETGLDLPGGDFGEFPGTLLDITRPEAEQAGERRPGTVGRWYQPNMTSFGPTLRILYGEKACKRL